MFLKNTALNAYQCIPQSSNIEGFLHNQLPHFTVEFIGNKVETGIVVLKSAEASFNLMLMIDMIYLYPIIFLDKVNRAAGDNLPPRVVCYIKLRWDDNVLLHFI